MYSVTQQLNIPVESHIPKRMKKKERQKGTFYLLARPSSDLGANFHFHISAPSPTLSPHSTPHKYSHSPVRIGRRSPRSLPEASFIRITTSVCQLAICSGKMKRILIVSVHPHCTGGARSFWGLSLSPIPPFSLPPKSFPGLEHDIELPSPIHKPTAPSITPWPVVVWLNTSNPR